MNIDRDALDEAMIMLFEEFCPAISFSVNDEPHYRAGAKAAITAYLSAMAEKGFKMMPREPTDVMWLAFNRIMSANPREEWIAMYDAFAEAEKEK